MQNLNAENIINEIQSLIKALKDCGGWVKRGNGEGWFNHEILADALALINSQEQRIKELAEELAECYTDKTKLIKENAHLKHFELEAMRGAANSYKMHYERLTEENEKLTRNLEIANLQVECKERILESYMMQYGTATDKEVFLKKERADTVRKMQERLQLYFGTYVLGYKIPLTEALKAVNQIAKEMLEGE